MVKDGAGLVAIESQHEAEVAGGGRGAAGIGRTVPIEGNSALALLHSGEKTLEAGLEPLEAEADTSALVNAAWKADVLTVDGSQLLIHVGHTSTPGMSWPGSDALGTPVASMQNWLALVCT